MKKTKFQVIKEMLKVAKKLGMELNKADKRVSYIIQCHEFFIWKNDEEFNSFIETCIADLKEQAPESIQTNRPQEIK